MSIFSAAEEAIKTELLNGIDEITEKNIYLTAEQPRSIFPLITITLLDGTNTQETSGYDKIEYAFEIGVYTKGISKRSEWETLEDISGKVLNVLQNRANANLRAAFNAGWSIDKVKFGVTDIKGNIVFGSVITMTAKISRNWQI